MSESVVAGATSIPPPRLMAIGGLSGTGKSTLAQSLAVLIDPAGNVVTLRSDVERKALFGVDETTRLDASAYTATVTNLVYDRLARKAEGVLANGQSVVVDAVFSRPDERDSIEQVAHARAALFHGVWLETATETLRARVAARINDASDATPEIVDRQSEFDPGLVSWHRIDAGGTPAETFAAARRVLDL